MLTSDDKLIIVYFSLIINNIIIRFIFDKKMDNLTTNKLGFGCSDSSNHANSLDLDVSMDDQPDAIGDQGLLMYYEDDDSHHSQSNMAKWYAPSP
jgi:hypothetical protein